MSADYVMIGGFLGAGKTTAVLALAEQLTAEGRRVGLITNDQSVGLVDTTLALTRGFAVEEITGGCFCCRFASLTEAADRLQERARPDVFVAEPVGSCTDLRASVSYPLRRLYGDAYRVAPLSVLVDPIRAARMLGVEEGRAFSPRVQYVYEKQLEEADLIVINKVDLIDDARLRRLRSALNERFPSAEVLAVSARQRIGLDDWFGRIFGTALSLRPSPAVDYDIYADGEARLGWFNATIAVTSDGTANGAVDGNGLLVALAASIQARLAAAHIEIAHCKMTLTPAGFGTDLAALNLVRSDAVPELSHRLADPLVAGELLLNLRAEAPPDTLRSAVLQAITDAESKAFAALRTVHAEAFSPPRPTPTHRMATA
jgi:Ni2+-binding GTPase involved in maturation of urease and hydrogenase